MTWPHTELLCVVERRAGTAHEPRLGRTQEPLSTCLVENPLITDFVLWLRACQFAQIMKNGAVRFIRLFLKIFAAADLMASEFLYAFSSA